MTTALLGYGATYAIDDGAGQFVPLAEVVDITPPNQQIEDVEATHMTSPNRTREYIAGLIDPGEASLTINWVPNNATDQRLLELRDSGEALPHRITWSNGVTWTFTGYVKGFEPGAPIDDRMTAVVTLRVSGSTVVAPAA